MRLTWDARQALLDLNEGLSFSTTFEGKNFREYRTYTIIAGRLYISASGKSSWSDSRYSHRGQVATDEETHRFRGRYRERLTEHGLEDRAAEVRRTMSAPPRKPRVVAADPEPVTNETQTSHGQRPELTPAGKVILVTAGLGYLATRFGKPIVPRLSERLSRRDAKPEEDGEAQP